ncbi:hypothetical protein BDY24DRAFT_399505 [Mrakia frigida]|uniref:uncharacterized protein n=1 Tax=Mrakia frigida TaxID=29902 RepID=UPI003FCBF53B
MASPSSSDHSSPSGSSNLDERLPPTGYPSHLVSFAQSQRAGLHPQIKASGGQPGFVGVVGEENFSSAYHHHHQAPSYPSNPSYSSQQHPPAAHTVPPSSSSSSAPPPPPQPSSQPTQRGVVRMDDHSGKQVVDVGPRVLKNLPLIITGVPLSGAKSRVETQIKIRIALALPTQATSSSSFPNGPQDESTLAFVNTYSHVKLQKGTATKRKSRKSVAAEGGALGEPNKEEMLWLETEVYCATEGTEEEDEDNVKLEEGSEKPKGLRVFACAGCRTREVKRAQRKLAARIRPTLSDSELDTPYPSQDSTGASGGTQDERHKIVLFNCGSVLDFSTGECTLPARVTCYCRHHREKVGFLLTFLLKDYLGNIVASGSTPPIMITDDHKTSGKTAPAEPSMPSIPKSLIMPSNPPPPPAAPAASSKGRVRRAVKKRESSTSGDEDRRRSSASSSAKPYDRKVSPSTTASSVAHTPRTLSMTPLSTSVPSSPAIKNGLSLSPITPKNFTPQGSTTFNQLNLPTTISEHQLLSEDSTPNNRLSPSIPGYVGGAMNLGRQGTSPNGQSPSYNPQDLVSHLVEHAEREREGAMLVDEMMDGGEGSLEVGAGGFTPPESSLSSSNTSRRTSDSEEQLRSSSNGFDMQMEDPTLSFDSLLDYGSSLQQNGMQMQDANDHFPELSSYSHSSLPPTSSADPISFESLFAFPASPPSSIPSPTLYNASQPPHHQLQQQQQQYRQHQRDEPSTASTSSSTSDLLLSNVHWPALQPPSFPVANTTPRASYQSPTPPPPPPPKPVITRLIPGEGPMHGGIEVTILGANFVPGLTCVFGDSPATNTQLWSENTIVCVLPPSSCPGPVVVSFKAERGTQSSPSGGLQLFTYLDTSDRALMELALQVVGLKMTGRIEDAKNVALRIVGQTPPADNSSPQSNNGSNSSGYQQNSLSRDAYHSPSASRRGSVDDSASTSAAALASLPWGAGSRGGNFQDTIINFLGLVELDTSDVPGAASASSSSSSRLLRAVSLKNKQGQTLLHLAVMLGFHRLVSHLIDLGADLDSRDKNGYTSLSLAALCGRVACSRLLLDAGASEEIVTADGKTPFDLAREKDQVDVESLLARRGELRRESGAVVDSGISLGSSEEGSIDADNPSSDEEFDDDYELQLPRATSPRISVEDEDEDADESESEDVLPLKWSASTGTGGRSRSSTYLRRRASIDSQRTEGTIYAAQVFGGDGDSYLSDGGSIRHYPAHHHPEIPQSPLSSSMDKQKAAVHSEVRLVFPSSSLSFFDERRVLTSTSISFPTEVLSPRLSSLGRPLPREREGRRSRRRIHLRRILAPSNPLRHPSSEVPLPSPPLRLRHPNPRLPSLHDSQLPLLPSSPTSTQLLASPVAQPTQPVVEGREGAQ